MAISVNISQTDTEFECGSFNESDVVNDQYTFELNSDYYGGEVGGNGNYGDLINIFVVGRGPFNNVSIKRADMIIFSYCNANSVNSGRNIELRTYCSSAGRAVADRKTNAVTVTPKTKEANSKVIVTLNFLENKAYPRDRYEYRYLAWTSNDIRVDNVRNDYQKIVCPQSYLDTQRCYVVNNLTTRTAHTLPASWKKLNFMRKGSGTSGSVKSGLEFALQPLFPSFVYGSNILDPNFVCILKVDAGNGTDESRFFICWGWIWGAAGSVTTKVPVDADGNAQMIKISNALKNDASMNVECTLTFGSTTAGTDASITVNPLFDTASSANQTALACFTGMFSED